VAVTPWTVSDALWERLEPLLPKKRRRFRYPGRRPLPDREALQGILFVLHTRVAWRHLPLELGFGSGSTCYRRMVAWQRGGVWEQLHALLLAELRSAGELEWSRAVADSSHVQAKGGSQTGPSPVDRARNGSKHHLLVDARGIPLAWTVTGGNHNHVTQLVPLVERVPPVRGRSVSPPTEATTTTSTGASCAGAGSAQRLLAARPPRLRPRPYPLGRRAHLRLAAPVQATARPLRPSPRDPRSVPRHRLLPRLFPAPASV
jgi:transposase